MGPVDTGSHSAASTQMLPAQGMGTTQGDLGSFCEPLALPTYIHVIGFISHLTQAREMPVACVHHSQALGSICSSQSFIWAGWPLPRCQAPCLLRGLLDTRLQPTEWIQLFSLQEQGQGGRPGVCIAIPYSW